MLRILSFVLGGDHTRTKTVITSRIGALSKFATKRETCVGCKTVLDDDSKDLND